MTHDELKRALIGLTAEQDQDRARALLWWRENSDLAKLIVWRAIQRKDADLVSEIVLRFAQIGFTEIALAAEGEAGA